MISIQDLGEHRVRLVLTSAALLAGCAAHAPQPPIPVDEVDPLVVAMAEAEASIPPPDLSLPPEERLLPMCVWVHAGPQLGFTYLDPAEGPAIRIEVSVGDRHAPLVVPIDWAPAGLEVVDAPERESLGLPERPDWFLFFRDQPVAGDPWGTWRLDPRLAGRFSDEAADELQVLLFDGSPQAMVGEPELAWVGVRGCDDDACWGRVLDEPRFVSSVRQGERVFFSIDVQPEDELMLIPDYRLRSR